MAAKLTHRQNALDALTLLIQKLEAPSEGPSPQRRYMLADAYTVRDELQQVQELVKPRREKPANGTPETA